MQKANLLDIFGDTYYIYIKGAIMENVKEPACRKLRVMIIEDDDTIRKLLAIEFKRRGHEILEFADTAAAMLILNRQPKPGLDAAIVDLMNIGYGGNMGDWLRKMKEYMSIAVLYYTALTRQQFDSRILDKPNIYYMHKEPGSIKQVVEKIENVC